MLLAVAVLSVLSCDSPWGIDLSVNVTHPPAGGVTAHGSYIIKWTLEAPDYDDTGVLLFVDTDLNSESGLIQISDTLSTESTGFLWDCSAFPEDSYYVMALVFYGDNHETDYSQGTITVSHER